MTLVAVSVGALSGWTARHAEDFPQKSRELAQTGTNRRRQILNIRRQLPSALPFGMALKAPQGPGRVP